MLFSLAPWCSRSMRWLLNLCPWAHKLRPVPRQTCLSSATSATPTHKKCRQYCKSSFQPRDKGKSLHQRMFVRLQRIKRRQSMRKRCGSFSRGGKFTCEIPGRLCLRFFTHRSPNRYSYVLGSLNLNLQREFKITGALRSLPSLSPDAW